MMTKVISGRVLLDGTHEPQQVVELGPLEEAAMVALWACGAHEGLRPAEPTTEEKFQLLSNPNGAELLSNAMLDYQTRLIAWGLELDSLILEREKKQNAFNSKMELMVDGELTC